MLCKYCVYVMHILCYVYIAYMLCIYYVIYILGIYCVMTITIMPALSTKIMQIVNFLQFWILA